MKKTITILIFLVFQTNFCNSQGKICDTISFYDLKFNGNNFYVKFEKIKKYIDDTTTKATVSPGKYSEIPFKKFKDKDKVYTIYSDFFDFSYTDISEVIYIQRMKITKKIDLRINKIKITDNLKAQDLKKIFPNIYEDDDKVYQLRLLIKKDKKRAYLFFNFKNNKLSDIMLDN